MDTARQKFLLYRFDHCMHLYTLQEWAFESFCNLAKMDKLQSYSAIMQSIRSITGYCGFIRRWCLQ